MKTLKFRTESALAIMAGKVNKTWRLFDDKQLELDDILLFINSDDGKNFGYAKVTRITIKHVAELNDNDMQGHKIYNNFDEILAECRRYYGQRVNLQSIVKVVDFTFLGAKYPNNEVNKSTVITEIKIYTDGGSRGNPGPSACSYVLVDMDGKVIESDGAYLGITTNNQAEYQAVLRALKNALVLGITIAHVYMDSLLVVNQMNGIYKVRNRDLWPIHEAIKEQVKLFDKVTFTHIPREMNKIADDQVNSILDNQSTIGIKSELI
jgi:ribonuclease HI